MIIYKCPRARPPYLESRKRLNLSLTLINNRGLKNNMLLRKLKSDLPVRLPTAKKSGSSLRSRRRPATKGNYVPPIRPTILPSSPRPSRSPSSRPPTPTTPTPLQICIPTPRCLTRGSCATCPTPNLSQWPCNTHRAPTRRE